MSISIVSVVVPSSGDGPAASIANLVGKKTVILSGTFSGRYVLLGSQDDAHFVPVAFFDSNGEESLEVTLPLALSSVRVRCEAANPSGVAMSVSGVLSVGENHFVTVASIPAGSSGRQPIIDLETEVEQDLGFLCVGSFQGLLVLEGSLDGTHFCPIGDGFRANRQPISFIGSSLPLEFSPLTTCDLVRYIRVTLDGVSSSLVVVTFGGSNPSSGGPSATTTLAKAYENGSSAADQTIVLLDTKGGGVVIDGRSGLDTSPYALSILTENGSALFPRAGGLSITSSISKPAATSVDWYEIDLSSAILTLTGSPATTDLVAMVHVGNATINGIGCTIDDAYNLLIESEPNGTATLTRPWSLGVYGNVQFADNVCVGWGFYPAASASGTLVFASAGSTEPSVHQRAGRVHVLATDFYSIGTSNLAALTVAADEPPKTGQDQENYTHGIPLRYNGKNYYLLARDLSPPS